jgi:glycolate oxidase iron-sulfur subunit
MARKLINQMDEPLPVIVDSAGCGSTLKEYGHLVENDEAADDYSQRVFDISEFLHHVGFDETLRVNPTRDFRVAYHLVHGQKISSQPKDLLASVPGLQLLQLNEADMCCGSAGIYNVTQPKMARELLERKWKNVRECSPNVCVTGNPGCHAWIAQASREGGNQIPVLHLSELLEASFIGIERFLPLRVHPEPTGQIATPHQGIT